MEENHPQNKWAKFAFISAILFLLASFLECFYSQVFVIRLSIPYNLTLMEVQRALYFLGGTASIMSLAVIHKPTKWEWAFGCLTLGMLIFSFGSFYLPRDLLWSHEDVKPTALSNTITTVRDFGRFVFAILLFIFYTRYSAPASPYKKPLLLLAVLYTFGLIVSFLPRLFYQAGDLLTSSEIGLGEFLIFAGDHLSWGTGLSFLLSLLPLQAFPIALFVMAYAVIKVPPAISGIYEGREDDETVKFGLLKDGVYELYENGESVEEGKWELTNNKIHITTNDPEVGMVVNINQINADGSLTEIGEMIDGKQEDTPKEAQFTYKKIK